MGGWRPGSVGKAENRHQSIAVDGNRGGRDIARVAGRVPPGGVLEVIGVVNAKVVRVSVALPNGKTAKGMAKVADLE